MHAFKDILKDFKFDQPIDFDKVRSMTVTKEDIRGGSRLVTSVQYDNGTRFEVNGNYTGPEKAKPVTAAAKAEPIKIVGEGELKQGEAVVSTAAPTASAPGAIKQTTPSATLTAEPVKADK